MCFAICYLKSNQQALLQNLCKCRIFAHSIWIYFGSLGIAVVGCNYGGVFRVKHEKHPHIFLIVTEIPKDPAALYASLAGGSVTWMIGDW